MARTTIRTEDITASEVTTAKMATDPTNASNLSSGSVPLAQLGNVDTSGITANQDDIALLGFKVAANGSLARYDLVDQSIDAFEDASGVDASASTNEIRDSSNYYSGSAAGAILNAYTSGSGNFTAGAGITSVEVVVVAGGGGGGGLGGGGGAGGVVHHTGYTTVPTNTYAYSVGTGGAGCAYNAGTAADGGNSTFGTGTVMTAEGGGGSSGSSSAGRPGGSGGGGNGGYSSAGGASDQANPSGGGTGYGNAGGDAQANGGYFSGGGGGASAAGADGSTSGSTCGAGGAGKLFTGFEAYGTTSGNVASSGSNGGYFGGGGGGGGNGTPGAGGVGGGAVGKGGTTAADNGLANTGGGGGGVADNTGGTGGSGIVIVKQADQYLDMTLVSNAQTAQSAPTTGDLVITYTDGAGTATVNTDIKAYISRNGSAYTSAVTLVSQGTTGGHTILTANGVDLSGITTGTSMRWKIETLNQAVGKQTRIQAVSLGWS